MWLSLPVAGLLALSTLFDTSLAHGLSRNHNRARHTRLAAKVLSAEDVHNQSIIGARYLPNTTNMTLSKRGDPTIVHAFYNASNWDRPCDNMRADSIPRYVTHAHWAYADIREDLEVVITDDYNQWGLFMSISSHKIVAFGGESGNYEDPIYNGLKAAAENPEVFAAKLVKFVADNSLDGVSFSWVTASEEEWTQLRSIISLVRTSMPKDKTITVVLPARVVDLENFTEGLETAVASIDYIIASTYIQARFGIRRGQEDCPSGNCLRAYGNVTETLAAMAGMVEAGIPAKKLLPDWSAYGRTYQMAKSNCSSTDCRFSPKKSVGQVTPGLCTDTPGILSHHEIIAIRDNDPTSEVVYDQVSSTNIMTYGDDQWVTYSDSWLIMAAFGLKQGFGGVSIWSVDAYGSESVDIYPNDDYITAEEPGVEPYIPPNCNASYANLDELDAALGSIPDDCVGVYTAKALRSMLDGGLKHYQEIMSDGYDKKFKTYAQAVADNAALSVHDFMYNNGSQYFTCEVDERTTCCDDCKEEAKNAHGESDNYCKYCRDGKDCTVTCGVMSTCARDFVDWGALLVPALKRDHPVPGIQTKAKAKFTRVSQPCPPDFSQRGQGPHDPYPQSVHWTLRDDQADHFYADLETTTGIPKDKTKQADYKRDNSCSPAEQDKPDDDCWNHGMDFNIVVPNGYGRDDVSNPKDVVTDALAKSSTMLTDIDHAIRAIELHASGSTFEDLCDAISMPILMMVGAVETMQQVEDTAEQIEEAKRKAIIMTFLSAILFVIPFVGEGAAAAGMAGISTALRLVSVVANAAMDLHSVIEDPKSGALGLMSLVLEPLAILDVVKVAKAANLRRALPDTDIAKLGGTVTKGLDIVKKVRNACKK